MHHAAVLQAGARRELHHERARRQLRRRQLVVLETAPLAAQPILWAGDDDARSMVGGQAETFSCACRTRGVRVRLHEDEALAITPVPSTPFAGVPGDTIMTHLTHFVQFDAHAPRAASSFFVLLANGTREYVEPPNATLANATASNATAALPRLLPRRTLGPA